VVIATFLGTDEFEFNRDENIKELSFAGNLKRG
jgi:hypothetical protein